MESVDIVFCVLTYKNHQDLHEFILSLKSKEKLDFSYKIIVVNNYADDHSSKLIKNIAIKNKCIFSESENKGYGYGNNIAISLAKQNYTFKYLIVCNPDVIIKKFKISSLKGEENNIIAPKIVALNKRNQNPLNYNYMPLVEKLFFYSFKYDNKLIFYLAVILNKLDRNLNIIKNTLLNKSKYKVYSCHGSFIIFSYNAINKLNKVFDENIFLFCEEGDLAQKCRKNNITITFNKNIEILHKEDGSMSISNINLNKIHKQSYLYYYKKWYSNKI